MWQKGLRIVFATGMNDKMELCWSPDDTILQRSRRSTWSGSFPALVTRPPMPTPPTSSAPATSRPRPPPRTGPSCLDRLGANICGCSSWKSCWCCCWKGNSSGQIMKWLCLENLPAVRSCCKRTIGDSYKRQNRDLLLLLLSRLFFNVDIFYKN